MPVLIRVGLRIAQHGRVEHIDLERRAPIGVIAAQESLELGTVFRIPNQRGVEGHGVASAIGEEIDEGFTLSVRFHLPGQHLAHGIDVGRRAVRVSSIGGT